MKKIVGLGLVILTSVSLVACGSNDKKNESENSSSSPKTEKVGKESEESSSKEETSGDFVKTAADATFDGTTLKGNAYTIKITEHKIIQPGEKGNEYGDKPIIAFWYDTLVAPDYDNSRPIDASTSWISCFKAIQDNDPNKVNELNIAGLPDNAFLDSQSAEIKPGGTVQNAVAYELSDETTPVTLVAGTYSKEFGRVDFDIK